MNFYKLEYTTIPVSSASKADGAPDSHGDGKIPNDNAIMLTVSNAMSRVVDDCLLMKLDPLALLWLTNTWERLKGKGVVIEARPREIIGNALT